MRKVVDGVYPTMVTAFTEKNELDEEAVPALVRYYAKGGCAGIFAVCQSSELFYLSLPERLRLCSLVVEAAGKEQIPLTVVASGHVADSLEEQAEELCAMAETGADALVWISNRLDIRNEGDNVWLRNAEFLLSKLPEKVPLGIYECPFPYKRLLTPEILRWCRSTGRFRFIKDTCCDPKLLEQRLSLLKGTEIKLFNANAQTLLYSLEKGASGYSGVMANFHPWLYSLLCRIFSTDLIKARRLSQFLSMCAFTESLAYPVTAKYHLSLEGIPMGLSTRTRSPEDLTQYQKMAVEQMRELTRWVEKELLEK